MRTTARFRVRSKGRPRGGISPAVAALGTMVALSAAVAVFAFACSHTPEASAPTGEPQPPAAGSEPSEPSGQSKQLSIWLTGYSWQDNTPPGSSKVGEPVLHQVADGTGTFADPITVATPGHKGDQEWKPGTKFYLPTVQRYVIVEDSGAADAPEGTDTHLDMWSAGKDGTKDDVDKCMGTFTGRVPAQLNPPDGLPVMAGPIYAGRKCNIPPQPANLGTYDNPGGHRHGHDNSDDNSDDDSGHGNSGHHNGSHHDDSDHGDNSGHGDN